MWLLPLLLVASLIAYFAFEAYFLMRQRQGKPLPKLNKQSLLARLWDWL